MPSIDEDLLLQLHASGRTLFLAEQNNGYIWQSFLKVLYRHGKGSNGLEHVVTINTLGVEGKSRFIHSGTYEELTQAFGLTSSQIAQTIRDRVSGSDAASHS